MLEAIIILLFLLYVAFGVGIATSFRKWYWVWHDTETLKGKARMFGLTFVVFVLWPFILAFGIGHTVGRV